MTRKAYVVMWHVRNRPEISGYSYLISDRSLAQLRASMANEDNPHLFYWVEEVDALNQQAGINCSGVEDGGAYESA